DITPSNIWLVSKNPVAVGSVPSPIHVKLMDFGLAKDIQPGAQAITDVGHTLGTPGYIAPEQLAGNACIGSDLYSLGVVLAEMCFNIRPQKPGDIPSGHRADIPSWFSKCLRRLLNHEPDLRPSAPEILALFDDHMPRI